MHQKTQNHFLKFSIHLSVRKSREKLQTNVWKIYSKPLKKFKHTGTPQKIFKYNPLFCSFSLQVIFFSEQPFYGNHSTLDSHTNTVISHTLAYSSTKMASKTMTRSIQSPCYSPMYTHQCSYEYVCTQACKHTQSHFIYMTKENIMKS